MPWPALILRVAFLSLLLVTEAKAGPTDFLEGNAFVKGKLVSDFESFQPKTVGATARIGILLDIEPGWHIYWKYPGSAGLSTKVTWHLPEQWNVDTLRWPLPYKFVEAGDIVTYGYSKQLLLIADLFAPDEDVQGISSIQLAADVTFLVCSDKCVPGKLKLNRSFDFGGEAELLSSQYHALFEQYDAQVPQKWSDAALPFESSISYSSYPLAKAALTRALHDSVELKLRGPWIKKRSLKELATLVQLFPSSSADIEFEEAYLQNRNKDEVTILLPYINNENSKKHIPLDLVLAIKTDDESSTESRVLALEKTTILPVVSDSKMLSPKLIASSVGQPNILRFREPAHSSYPQGNEGSAEGSEKSQETEGLSTDQVASAEISFIWAIVLAFFAGIILNLMPCVLPIISIKVINLLDSADKSPKEIKLSSLAFASGILSALATLALVVITLRSFGQQLGWGFQFQHPGFILTLVLVIFVLALSFFGLWDLRLPFIGHLNPSSSANNHLAKHFFDGILATALSTPCTAPFLGSALAVAFSQSALWTLLIFLAIGLGLSLPYLLLAFWPASNAWLPRPGAWMIRVRQLMGFMLCATVVWLLFVLEKLSGSNVLWIVSLLLFTAFLLWLSEGIESAIANPKARHRLKSLLLISFVVSCYLAWPSEQPGDSVTNLDSAINWQPYSAELVETELAKGRTVFIDFTAQWCITCKANEHLVLSRNSVAQTFSRYNVTTVKADWTNSDERVTTALKSYGGHGVPFYVVLSSRLKEPLILPTLLSTGAITEALEKASEQPL